MKKHILLAVLVLSIAACKKETKTVTKTDPVTGKTTTVEVPVEDTATPAEISLAITDSAGVYRQKFLLETGKTYPFTTVQKNNVTITAPNGQKQTMSSENSDEVTFTVNSLKDGIYDITINFLTKKTSQSAQGKTVSLSTAAPPPKEEALKSKWTLDKALTDNQLQMKMTVDGKILSITGFQKIYDKVQNTINTLTKDANTRKALMANAKASFDEKILKDQFSKNILILPAKGAKMGDKWSRSENASADGAVQITSNYQLKSADDQQVVVTVTGGMPRQADRRSQNGITQSVSTELTQNGTLTFDAKTGWLKNQNIKVNTKQTESLSDGKQTQSMTNNTVSSVIVNP